MFMLRVKVRNTDIRCPQQGNDKWEFHTVTVYHEDGASETQPFLIADLDLQHCFKEATGRYPEISSGSSSEKQDLLDNWEVLEPKLQAFCEKWFNAKNVA
jgi:hypothetical protein